MKKRRVLGPKVDVDGNTVDSYSAYVHRSAEPYAHPSLTSDDACGMSFPFEQVVAPLAIKMITSVDY